MLLRQIVNAEHILKRQEAMKPGLLADGPQTIMMQSIFPSISEARGYVVGNTLELVIGHRVGCGQITAERIKCV